MPDLESAAWRKSSFSAENGTYVEVAFSGPLVGVCDSTSPESGHFSVDAVAWTEFLRRVKRNKLER